MCSRIATQHRKAKVCCMQFGAAHARHQRIAGRMRNRFHPGVAVAGLQCRALVGGRGEQGDVRFCVAATNTSWYAESRSGSTQLSFSPKLIEMTSPRLLSTAYLERAEDIGVVVRLGQY